MYLRFTGPGTATRAHVAPGLFRSAYKLAGAGDEDKDPIVKALWCEIDWFCDNLPVPNRFDVKAKGRWWADGICWFRHEAREMLTHAYALAALIEECGVPMQRIRTCYPGQILYRDEWQVVAKPERYLLAGRMRSPRRAARARAGGLTPTTGGHHTKAYRVRPGTELSSGRQSDVRATPAKRASSADCAPSRAARSSCWKGSAATIRAPAGRGRGFKRCCLRSGRYDGAERRDYWR